MTCLEISLKSQTSLSDSFETIYTVPKEMLQVGLKINSLAPEGLITIMQNILFEAIPLGKAGTAILEERITATEKISLSVTKGKTTVSFCWK